MSQLPALYRAISTLTRRQNPMPYTPLTGQPCTCKRGVARDNCPACEGTGRAIDFAAIHRARNAENSHDAADRAGFSTLDRDTIARLAAHQALADRKARIQAAGLDLVRLLRALTDRLERERIQNVDTFEADRLLDEIEG